MPPGVICITTSSYCLDEFDSSWKVIDKIKRMMSWGSANIYIQIKI
jgi:hypothetical protein